MIKNKILILNFCFQIFEDKLSYGLWPEKKRAVFAETRPGSLIIKTLIRDGDAGYFQVKE